MRGKLFFALLFALTLWAGIAALEQMPAAAAPLPEVVLERCALPADARHENAPRERAQADSPAQHDTAPFFARMAACKPVQTQCYYRTAYQAFHLIGGAG